MSDDDDDTSPMMRWMFQLFTSDNPISLLSDQQLMGHKSLTKMMKNKNGICFTKESALSPDDVDLITKNRLEELKIINWSTSCCSLYPLNTNVRSNNEYGTTIKKTLNDAIRYLTDITNIILEGDIPKELRKRNGITPHNSQGMSIFALAHIISRPIIVLTESFQVGGIYLPLMISSHNCSKYPLVISYHLGCYAPMLVVVTKEQTSINSSDFILPLTYVDGRPMPLRTLNKLNPDQYSIIFTYLHIVTLPSKGQFQNQKKTEGSQYSTLAAVLCYANATFRAPGFLTLDSKDPKNIFSHCITDGCDTDVDLFCELCYQKECQNTVDLKSRHFH